MTPVEIILDGDRTVAFIISSKWNPASTEFITPGDLPFQLGLIVYGKGCSIQPHMHLPITRQVQGTTECIFVRKGICEIDFYDAKRRLLTSRKLEAGDAVLLLGGGHGFRMLEDTVLFEVKQGPYAGEADKERF